MNTERSGPDAISRQDSVNASNAPTTNEERLQKQNADQAKELEILREQLRSYKIEKKESEAEMVNVKQAQVEELKRM